MGDKLVRPGPPSTPTAPLVTKSASREGALRGANILSDEPIATASRGTRDHLLPNAVGVVVVRATLRTLAVFRLLNRLLALLKGRQGRRNGREDEEDGDLHLVRSFRTYVEPTGREVSGSVTGEGCKTYWHVTVGGSTNWTRDRWCWVGR